MLVKKDYPLFHLLLGSLSRYRSGVYRLGHVMIYVLSLLVLSTAILCLHFLPVM
jgi:hypothetical protein